MNTSEVLNDACVEVSVAWRAAEMLLGPTIGAWEPETLRIELERHGVPPTDSLMAKLLAAQTIVTTCAWTYDHDVLFAFALACDGIPAASNAIHHPTPEQLAWAIREIETLKDAKITDDHGFDPDAIDPAVAAVLLDEGMVVTPLPLKWAQDALDTMVQGASGLKDRVLPRFLAALEQSDESLRRTISKEPKDAETVQLHRLIECRLYEMERAHCRAKQHAILDRNI